MAHAASAVETQRTPLSQQAWLPTVISAIVLTLAGLGDSLLYPTLPLYAAQLGVPLMWIGVILSINKLIRLGGNHALALTISRLGYKRVAMLGVLLAAVSTFAYGMNPPVWIWLISRIAWGMAYAALRLCALGYATDAKQQGLNLGISRAIRELGPMVALFVGPMLITHISVYSTFQVFGVVTALALPFTWLLPDDAQTAKPKMSGGFAKPTWFDGLVFATAVADGVVIVTIGMLLRHAGMSELNILSVSAFLFIVKRLSVTVISPASGWLAGKWELRKLFLVSTTGFFISLVLISAGVTIVGLTALFVSTAINQTLAASMALQLSTHEKLNTLSALTTWRDLGTAVGALVGGYLLVLSGPGLIYGVLAIAVLALGFKVTRL